MPFEPGKSGNELTRFQPGQSGNPAGREPGKPERGTMLRRFLAAPIDYMDPSTGEYVRGTMEEAVTLALLAKASTGDVPAFKEIMDTVYGKPEESLRLNTDHKIRITLGGKPLPVRSAASVDSSAPNAEPDATPGT